MATEVKIIPYDDRFDNDFYTLNIEWLQTYFYVEPFDEEVLSKPTDYIIDRGGHIFYALIEGVVAGTVALMPTDKYLVYELTKMAVSPERRGHKIGQKLMQHCVDFSSKNRYKALILYSNTILENAIYIYRKFGFVELPLESDSPYKRSNIKMELKIS